MRAVLMAAILLAACASAEVGQSSACSTEITVSPSGTDALIASYTLCASTTSFAFEAYNEPQRALDWKAADTNFAFDGVTVRREDGVAFDHFDIRISADSTFHDRRYIAADRVGAGWSLYLEALLPADAPATLNFANFNNSDVLYAEGQTRSANGRRLALNSDAATMIYVGPRENVRRGSITLIAGDDIPPWLRDRLITHTGRAIERMTARFGRRPAAPTLIVTYAAAGRGQGTKGGVVSGDIVEIRIRGGELREDDQYLADSLTNTATHEAVHFWIGHIWESARNNEEPWAHEGAAEYLASRIWQSEESLRQEAGQRLNACLLRGNSAPLDGSEGPVHGNAPYDCGYSIMLAAEAASVRAGRGDIFDLWRSVVEHAGPEGFTPTGFLAEARARGGANFDAVATLLMSRSTNPDIATIDRRLSAIGIDTAPGEAGPSESYALLARGLMPVLRQECGEHGRSFGYSTAPNRLILDTQQTCGDAWANDPEVVSVNGASLIQSPGAAYEAILAACTAHAAIRFTTLDGRVLAPVTCTTAIPPMPVIYTVTSLPAFPQP